MMTWEELYKLEPGTILEEWEEGGVQCLVMRGPAALCAYVGIPKDHPLSGKDYDELDIHVHGGLTYANEGDGKLRDDRYFWWGWDYGHYGDYCFYNDSPHMKEFKLYELGDKKWLVEDIKPHVSEAAMQLKNLMSIYEK